MEYNAKRNKLIIPEYGRNIQKMIEYLPEVEDREKRTKMAHVIVRIMGQIQSNVKDSGEFRQKLWDHLFLIAGKKLDIDSPFPPPDPEVLFASPQKLSYGNNSIRYAHYGRNIQEIIKTAVDLEDGPAKEEFIRLVANHMKKSYLNWNRESVSDDLIRMHLSELSGKKLILEENVRLTNTSDILTKPPKKKMSSKTGHQNRNGRQRKNYKDKNHH